jgi:hypothetical protein
MLLYGMAWPITCRPRDFIMAFDSVPIMFISVLMLAIKQNFSARVIPLSRDVLARRRSKCFRIQWAE